MTNLILAMILMESTFNPNAFNKEGNAKGLMQITPIGVKEASTQCNLPKKPDLYNPVLNILYGTCLLNFYLKVSGSEEGALILYHGGYQQFKKYEKGQKLGPKTASYLKKVLQYKKGFKNGEFSTDVFCTVYNLPPILCRKDIAN